jgi:hypothetical protein
VAVTTRDERDLERMELREAYNRGRADERAQRRRHPVLMTLLFLAAAVGAALLALALVNGSFGDAGRVVDQNLAAAADRAEPAARNAADQASQTLRNVAPDTASNAPLAPGQPNR